MGQEAPGAQPEKVKSKEGRTVFGISKDKAEYLGRADIEFEQFEKGFLARQKELEAKKPEAEEAWKREEAALSDETLKGLDSAHGAAWAAWVDAGINAPVYGTPESESAEAVMFKTKDAYKDYMLKNGSKALLEAAIRHVTVKLDYIKMKADEAQYNLKKIEKDILGHPLPSAPGKGEDTRHYDADTAKLYGNEDYLSEVDGAYVILKICRKNVDMYRKSVEELEKALAERIAGEAEKP